MLTVIADENGGMVFVPMNEALPKPSKCSKSASNFGVGSSEKYMH